jgi:hypothetical protein
MSRTNNCCLSKIPQIESDSKCLQKYPKAVNRTNEQLECILERLETIENLLTEDTCHQPCVQQYVQQYVQPCALQHCTVVPTDTIDTTVSNLNTNTDVSLVMQPETNNINAKFLWTAYIKVTRDGTINEYLDGAIVSNVITDSKNNVIICVTCGTNDLVNNIEFYDATNTKVFEVANARETGVIVKYKGNGEFLWADIIKNIVDEMSEYGLFIASINVDSSDNIIAAVNCTSNIKIITKGNIETNLSKDINDAISCAIVKMDSNGLPIWCAEINIYVTNYSENYIFSHDIETDSSNNIYITGLHEKQLGTSGKIYNANGSLSTLIPSANGDTYNSFIVKFDSFGQCLWFNNIVIYRHISSVVLSENNTITVCGITQFPLRIYKNQIQITGNVNFGPNTQYHMYIINFDSNGIPIWISGIQNVSIFNDFYFNLFAYNTAENYTSIEGNETNVYVSARYNIMPVVLDKKVFSGMTDITMTSTTTVQLPSYTINGFDSILLKLDNGVPQWVTHISGTGNQIINSVASNSNDEIIICGLTDASLFSVFNAGSMSNGKTQTITGTSQPFQAKIRGDGIVQWIVTQQSTMDLARRKGCVECVSDNTNSIISVGQFIGNSTDLIFYNSDGTIANSINLNTNATDMNAYITKYYDYGQIINLTTPECPTKLKTITIGNEFYNTLIYYNNLPLRFLDNDSELNKWILFCSDPNKIEDAQNNITLWWNGNTWYIYGLSGNYILN